MFSFNYNIINRLLEQLSFIYNLNIDWKLLSKFFEPQWESLKTIFFITFFHTVGFAYKKIVGTIDIIGL